MFNKERHNKSRPRDRALRQRGVERQEEGWWVSLCNRAADFWGVSEQPPWPGEGFGFQRFCSCIQLLHVYVRPIHPLSPGANHAPDDFWYHITLKRPAHGVFLFPPAAARPGIDIEMP